MEVTDKDAVIFKDMPSTFLAARYHSWAATDTGFPDELKVTQIFSFSIYYICSLIRFQL